MSELPIIYSKASGQDLERIISLMEGVLIGQPEQHIVMACLALVISIQHPEATSQQLADGVRGASEWIALYIDSQVNPTSQSERMN